MHSNYLRYILSLWLSIAIVEVGVAQGRSASLAETDPTGIIMTVMAVSVVGLSLLMLSLIFTLLGRLMQRIYEKPEVSARSLHTECRTSSIAIRPPQAEEMVAIALALNAEGRLCTEEVALAISMALHAHGGQEHDAESYRLTFAPRRPSQWSAHGLGMRPQLPQRY